MKSILNFLANVWVFTAAGFVAVLTVYTLWQGIEFLRYWVWLALAVIAFIAEAMAITQENATWLVLIPIFTLPMLLASGVQSPSAVFPLPVSHTDPAEKQNSIQDA